VSSERKKGGRVEKVGELNLYEGEWQKHALGLTALVMSARQPLVD